MSQRRSRPEPVGRVGALVVLAVCFLTSAALRTGEVIAALPEALDDGYGNPVPQAVSKPVSASESPKAENPSVLIAELRRRSDAVKAREARLEAREQAVKAIERRIEDRLKQLSAARSDLEDTAAAVNDAAGKDVRRLADMYQQMKPKKAGQIFNEMAPSFAAGFLSEMRPDAAALIMASMDADKAYAVSLLMAGRNVRPASQSSEIGTR